MVAQLELECILWSGGIVTVFSLTPGREKTKHWRCVESQRRSGSVCRQKMGRGGEESVVNESKVQMMRWFSYRALESPSLTFSDSLPKKKKRHNTFSSLLALPCVCKCACAHPHLSARLQLFNRIGLTLRQRPPLHDTCYCKCLCWIVAGLILYSVYSEVRLHGGLNDICMSFAFLLYLLRDLDVSYAISYDLLLP